MTPQLPGPPKFGPLGPQSVDDFNQLWRWFTNVFQLIRKAVSSQQSISIQPQNSLNAGFLDENFPAFPMPMGGQHTVPSAASLGELAFSRVPYPFQANNNGYFGPTTQTVYISAGVGSGRALSTVYHNTGPGPLFVFVTIQATGAGQSTASVFSDGNPAPVAIIGQSAVTALNDSSMLSFVVLPGNYYEVTLTVGAVVEYWVEDQ